MKPLIKKYGEQTLREAADEIIEVDTSNEPPVVRLTEHARYLSFQILGRPPESRPTEPPQPDKPPEVRTIDVSLVPDDSPNPADEICCPGADEVPTQTESDATEDPAQTTPEIVRRPRKEVLATYRDFLQEMKKPHIVLDNSSTRDVSDKVTLSRPDLIVADEPKNLLVTVRCSLRSQDRQGLQDWLRMFGPDFDAVRIWPVESPHGWSWITHGIEPHSATPNP